MLQDGYIDTSRKILLLHIVHDIAMVSFFNIFVRKNPTIIYGYHTLLTRSMWHVNW